MARLSFAANSSLNTVFIFTLPYLSTSSCTRSSTTLPASSKKPDIIRIDYRTSQNTTRMQRQSLAKRVIFRCHSHTRHQCARIVAPILRFCTRESRDTRHRGLSMPNEARTLGTTKFFMSFNSSHSCSHAKHSTRVATWPLCSNSLRYLLAWFFMFFSQSLDHVALVHVALNNIFNVCRVGTCCIGFSLHGNTMYIDSPHSEYERLSSV